MPINAEMGLGQNVKFPKKFSRKPNAGEREYAIAASEFNVSSLSKSSTPFDKGDTKTGNPSPRISCHLHIQLFDDDVDELAGNCDDADDVLAVDEFPDVFIGQCDLLEVFLRDVS